MRASIGRWLFAALAVLLVAVPASALHAQEEEPVYTLRILDIEHDPAGRLAVSVRVSGTTEIEPPQFTALVDGIPQAVNTTPTRDVDNLAIVLAIDTSGSMLGAPLEAARDAAISLIDQLNDGDEVAIIRFSNTVSLALDFTADRAAARSVLNSLVAQGDTALYDTVAFASTLLNDFGPSRSNLVLLSDGQESGASGAERDATIASLVDSGATAFSFGLGTDSDTEYLRAVAEGSGGEFWEVADDRALGSLFSSLGGRLGATDLVEVETRPFAIGTHNAEIFATVMGQRLAASETFEVTNEGMIAIAPIAVGTPGDPITVSFSTLVDPSAVRLSATLNGEALVASGTTLTIDPWRFDPGTMELAVRAEVSAGLAASASTELNIPALTPQLTVEQDSPSVVTARQRVQGSAETSIVIRDGEQVLSSTTDRELTVELPAGAEDIAIELQSSDGTVLATRTVSGPPAAASGGGLPVLPVGAAVAAVGVLGLVLMLRRRGDRPEPTPLRVRAARRVVPSSPPRDLELGTLRVRSADGTEQSYRMGPRPLTVGRSPSCDVVLDDPEVRPMHARISAAPGGQFRIHGLSAPGVPYQQQQHHDEWLIVNSGEEIAIGGFIVSMEAAAAVA